MNIKKSLLFIGLTFFISWLIAGLHYLFAGGLNTPSSTALCVLYMFVPLVAAVIVQKVIYKESVKSALGISFRLNRWFVIAWLLPPLLVFAALGVSLLLPGVEYAPDMEGMFERYSEILKPEQIEQLKEQINASSIHPIWVGLILGMVAGITVNAVAAFGEEAGWRGFLLSQWWHMGFWKSSFLIGLVWGIWHAPLILQGHNYPQHPITGVFMMTILCILLAPIFSYVRLRSNSVIAVSVLHGSLNGTAGLAIMMVKGGSDLLVGPPGLAGFAVLILANIGLLCHNLFWAKERIEGRLKNSH